MKYKMFINLTPINFQYKTTKSSVNKQEVTSPDFAGSAHDTISFGVMEKKEFEGIFAVVEKFKALVKKFNTNDDTKLGMETATNTGEEIKWVIIPSKEHDPEGFESNVEKLKALSCKTWQTKTFNAESYLEDGDFHIYLENGQPKLGVKFWGDKIEEIQGESNNGRIPIDYFDVMQKHINENKLKLTDRAESEIYVAQNLKQEITKIKTNLREAIENNDVKTIFNYLCIAADEDKDGYLDILEYRQPSNDYTFKDLGIDENKLFEKIKKIKGHADFSNSMVTDLGNLEYINGYAYFNNSQITDLGKLKSIWGNAVFRDSRISNLGKLEFIGRNVAIKNSPLTVEDFKNIQIGGGIIIT